MKLYSTLIAAVLAFCSLESSAAQMDERPLIQGRSVRSNAQIRAFDVATEIRQHQIRQHKPVKEYVLRELAKPQPFSGDAISNDDLPKTATPVRQWDLTDPWSGWCEAAWDQTCSGDEQWVPPDGWEICRYNLVVDSISKGEWRINSAEKRRISVHLNSWGSRFLNRPGFGGGSNS